MARWFGPSERYKTPGVVFVKLSRFFPATLLCLYNAHAFSKIFSKISSLRCGILVVDLSITLLFFACCRVI